MNPEQPQLASVTDLTSYRNRNKVQNDVFRPNRRVTSKLKDRPTMDELEKNEKNHLARKRAAANPDTIPSAITNFKAKATRVIDHGILLVDHTSGGHIDEPHPHCADCKFGPGSDVVAVSRLDYS